MDLFFIALQLFEESTAPFAAVSRHLLPVLCVDVQGFKVTLANVLVKQSVGWPNASLAGGKFATQEIFRNASIPHPSHVTKPSESALSEECVHGGKTCDLEDLYVCNFVSPVDTEDATKTAQVEAVQFVLLSGVCCTCFAAIQESADDAGIVYCHLG